MGDGTREKKNQTIRKQHHPLCLLFDRCMSCIHNECKEKWTIDAIQLVYVLISNMVSASMINRNGLRIELRWKQFQLQNMGSFLSLMLLMC